ncbi:hypothetical protein WG904_19300 [Pedobacter sp. Du54]|uniref:hypothetical protein n=1 Tax=Pedobacter anseongensis TaxID=3133439 RepID=UPI0030B64000
MAPIKLSTCSLILLLFSITAQGQRSHPTAPKPGVYSSSMMTSWLTVTPKMSANPSKSRSSQVDYGVGSTSFKGLFGDLILKDNGTYTFTKDAHGGTWNYNGKTNEVSFTGWLAPFKTHFFQDANYMIIYTGDVKMPDGNTLNIRYLKSKK